VRKSVCSFVKAPAVKEWTRPKPGAVQDRNWTWKARQQQRQQQQGQEQENISKQQGKIIFCVIYLQLNKYKNIQKFERLRKGDTCPFLFCLLVARMPPQNSSGLPKNRIVLINNSLSALWALLWKLRCAKTVCVFSVAE
jgi:hypothetical protein